MGKRAGREDKGHVSDTGTLSLRLPTFSIIIAFHERSTVPNWQVFLLWPSR